MKKIMLFLTCFAVSVLLSCSTAAPDKTEQRNSETVDIPEITTMSRSGIFVSAGGNKYLFSNPLNDEELPKYVLLTADYGNIFSGVKTGDKVVVYFQRVHDTLPQQLVAEEIEILEEGSTDLLPAVIKEWIKEQNQ